MQLLPMIEHLSPWAGLAVTLLGLLVFRWSWRQKRVGDHPMCRRCGYDLTGRPPGSGVCSECGASLSRKRAIRIGTRRMNRLFAGIGLAIALVGGVASYQRIRFIIRNDEYWQYEPLWLLERQADRSSQAVADAALNEMLRRANGREIPPAKAYPLVERVLLRQRDSSKQWSDGYLDVVDELHATATIPQEQWARYSQNGLDVTVRVRPRIRHGGALPIQFHLNQPRRDSSFSYSIEDVVIDLDKTTIGRGSELLSFAGNSRTNETIQLDTDEWQKIPIGHATVTIKLTMTTYDGDNRPFDPFRQSDEKRPPLLRVQHEFVVPIEITAGPSNPLIIDPRHEAEMIAACRPMALQVLIPDNGQGGAVVNMQSGRQIVPVDGMFKVQAQNDAGHWESFSDLRVRANDVLAHHLVFGKTFRDAHVRKVDLVLTPDPQAFANAFDCAPIWGTEIVYKDVPVIWADDPQATPHPAR